MADICDKIETCIIPSFFRLMGKKWAFPIFCRLKKETFYSFEEIIRISKRRVHRNSLSSLLNGWIHLKLINKSGNKYILTKKGVLVQAKGIQVSKILLHPDKCELVL